MLPCSCVDALVPQSPHVCLLVAPVCVGMLQRLLCLLPRYLIAVLGPASEPLGNLPDTPPVQPHLAAAAERSWREAGRPVVMT
jgi:hypothetical protein